MTTEPLYTKRFVSNALPVFIRVSSFKFMFICYRLIIAAYVQQELALNSSLRIFAIFFANEMKHALRVSLVITIFGKAACKHWLFLIIRGKKKGQMVFLPSDLLTGGIILLCYSQNITDYSSHVLYL